MKTKFDKITLRNGYEMPAIGYGVWQMPEGEDTVNAILSAIKAGYRHIDTAAIYRNEVSVGEAIKRTDIPREELFITSKVWNRCRGYDLTIEAFNKSLAKLGLDYLDLYLIHWPAAAKQFENFEEVNLSTWRALSELYKAGKIKAIGLSNFRPHHIKALMNTEVLPMVNQIEYHPGYLQDETVKFCKDNGIAVEAWSPLGSGRVLENETLIDIAKKHNKSTAQVCIRFCIQNGIIPLPKSKTPERIRENINVFDFELDLEDVTKIRNMGTVGYSGFDPDNPDF
jgi:diketogulonate reductase-like aldo/keto reductase